MTTNNKKLLVLAHPRCGTKYLAFLLQEMQLKVGHERVYVDGVVSWYYAIDNDLPLWLKQSHKDVRVRSTYQFSDIIQCLRDPLYAVTSIYYTENPKMISLDDVHFRYIKDSYDFRNKHLGIKKELNPLEHSIVSFLGWNQIISKQSPNLVVKVECAVNDLYEYLYNRGYKVKYPVKLPKLTVNKRYHPNWKSVKWESVDLKLLTKLDEWCMQNNYPALTQRVGIKTA